MGAINQSCLPLLVLHAKGHVETVCMALKRPHFCYRHALQQPACPYAVQPGTAASSSGSRPAPSGLHIVRFKDYRMAGEHRAALAAAMPIDDGAGWQWVERHNKAAAFPTDFGLLRLAAATEPALKVGVRVVLGAAVGLSTYLQDVSAGWLLLASAPLGCARTVPTTPLLTHRNPPCRRSWGACRL